MTVTQFLAFSVFLHFPEFLMLFHADAPPGGRDARGKEVRHVRRTGIPAETNPKSVAIQSASKRHVDTETLQNHQTKAYRMPRVRGASTPDPPPPRGP